MITRDHNHNLDTLNNQIARLESQLQTIHDEIVRIKEIRDLEIQRQYDIMRHNGIVTFPRGKYTGTPAVLTYHHNNSYNQPVFRHTFTNGYTVSVWAEIHIFGDIRYGIGYYPMGVDPERVMEYDALESAGIIYDSVSSDELDRAVAVVENL